MDIQEDAFVAANDDDVYSNQLLAQQSEVQQLAERNFAKTYTPWSVYVEPRGSFGQVYAQKNHFGNTFQSAGTRVGFDYLWANQHSSVPICAGLGFVADYVHTWGQRSHHSGKFQVNEGFGSVYSTIVPKSYRELSFNTIVGGGYSWYNFKRDVFGDSQVVATGNSGGPQCNVYFEMEYLFRHKIFPKIPKDFRIAPVVAMQYNYFKIDSYDESGAGRYDLRVSAQSASTLSTLVGFRTNYEFMADSPVTVRPELILLWQHQYLDPSLVTTAYSSLGVGPDIITAALPGFPRNTLFAGADVKVSIYDHAEVQLNYDFIYNKGFVSNVFFLELKGKF